MSELKRCPFCGGEAEILKNNECWGHGEFAKRVTIRCKKCSVRLSVSNLNSEIAIKHKAIKAWNTRIPMQNIVERLEEEKSNLTTWAEDMAFKIGIEKAIEIVKEDRCMIMEGMKPIHVRHIARSTNRQVHRIYCGKYGKFVQRVSIGDKYCRRCGTRIEWEN